LSNFKYVETQQTGRIELVDYSIKTDYPDNDLKNKYDIDIFDEIPSIEQKIGESFRKTGQGLRFLD
jgi:hypothetical protein